MPSSERALSTLEIFLLNQSLFGVSSLVQFATTIVPLPSPLGSAKTVNFSSTKPISQLLSALSPSKIPISTVPEFAGEVIPNCYDAILLFFSYTPPRD